MFQFLIEIAEHITAIAKMIGGKPTMAVLLASLICLTIISFLGYKTICLVLSKGPTQFEAHLGLKDGFHIKYEIKSDD